MNVNRSSMQDTLEKLVAKSEGELVLAQPAPKSAMDVLADCIGVPIPPELATFLSIADGESGNSCGLFGCDDKLLSADGIDNAIADQLSDEYQTGSDELLEGISKPYFKAKVL